VTHDELYAYLKAAGAPEVIFSHQNAPRPKPPYVLVEETGVTGVREEYCPQDARRYAEYAVNCRIQWHGARALINLSLLRTKAPQLRWTGDVQRIPTSLEDIQWEDRATCDAAYHLIEPVTAPEADGIIDTVSTTPTINERQWPAFISRRP
jgi:hypothetical protein